MKMDWFLRSRRLILACLMVLALALAGCSDGDDGDRGPQGEQGIPGEPGAPGAPGTALIDASTAPDSILAEEDIVSEITNVTISSPPVVDFTVQTADGAGVTGIGSLWEDSNRFVRFTITKLVAGTDGDADSWVAYTREETNDGSTPPDYDTGSSLVDHGDGTYTFTFNTDVAAVSGVDYEPGLTHRVAGQIGSGAVALEAQNLFHDFVPAGGELPLMKDVAVMESCNECHDDLVFHGRRFLVEYCVNCHNPGLAEGEGDMAFMTHKIHASGTFAVLDDAIDYSEVTYPQDLMNCRKCHNVDDEATPQGDNWKLFPTIMACGSCHDNVNFATGEGHAAGAQPDNTICASCHTAEDIEENHITPNATANNPQLLAGQRDIAYEIIEATVDGMVATVDFRINSDGEALDLTNLPADLAAPDSWPSFLLAYALPQGGIDFPADYNNLGQAAAQPIGVGLDDVLTAGNLSCTDGTCTAVLDNTVLPDGTFPADATMRAVGLQGYFQQDLTGDGASNVSLYTRSVAMPVAGDEARRDIASSAACAACHEVLAFHGGNRVITAEGGVEICTLCHVPNLSSSGRTLNVTHAEDTNNLKELIHGIHAAGERETAYEFVRAFRGSARFFTFIGEDLLDEYPDGHVVTFPAEVNNCNLCHLDGAFELPLPANVLETTVRTTLDPDGMDEPPTELDNFVVNARNSVPNPSDWVNSPTASTCYYCHDSALAKAHMEQNGGMISVADPAAGDFTTRQEYEENGFETCAVCHGPGKSAAVRTVHGLD